MPRSQPKSIAHAFNEAKADYAGMTESRFRRIRPGVSPMGVSGDWHNWAEASFVRMREYYRPMIRDDACAKFLVERAVDNVIGPGFRYEPSTGDKKLDKDLKQRQSA